MPNAIDNAISALRTHALALTTITVKSAPAYPIENADPFPMLVTHLKSGGGTASNASQLRFNAVIQMDFLFSRTDLPEAYRKIDAAAVEFMQKLAGDPKLGGALDSVLFSGDNRPTFEVEHTLWNETPVVALVYSIPTKSLLAPTT